MRLLVDTNVFMDILYNREGLCDNSKPFFDKTREYHDQIYVCASTIKDLAYFIRKSVRDTKKTNDILVNIFSKVTKIVGISADDAINALYEEGDYEDNVLAEVSQTTMCDAIISNNIKDFENKRVIVWTPNEYLKYRVKPDEIR